MKTNVIIATCLMFFFYYSNCQTANVTKGCSPLEVKFTAPQLSSYYWEFVEANATSVLQNPTHIFTKPGKYNVRLFEGNSKIGEILIIVYPDPIINFVADSTIGCAPFKVNFKSEIQLDTDLHITGYKWAFGDGGVSDEADPVYTYLSEGLFDVTLEITVDLTECNKAFTINKLIKVNEVKAFFVPDKNNVCDYSGKFKFTNLTTDEIGNTYHWDFGNGSTSDLFDPEDSIEYKNQGEYQISLTVTSIEGCINKYEKKITVGKPIFDLDFPPVGCIYEYDNKLFNYPYRLEHNTKADSFSWDFEPNPDITISSIEINNGDTIYFRKIDLGYQSGGVKTVIVKAFISKFCYSDTTFNIFIESPDPSFTMDPNTDCHDPREITLTANDTTHAKYLWDIKTLVPIGKIEVDSICKTSFIYDEPERDSLYWNKGVPVYIDLTIVSKNGCKDLDKHIYMLRKPNAHFIPSVTRGCAPLEVFFDDVSFSAEKIISWKYYYGTGDTAVFNSNGDHTYTFNDPGEYYMKLIIENEAGCIDTSAGVWIIVGEPIPPEFELDKTEICLGDSISVQFLNSDPRIDGFHLDTDDGRFSQCWKSKTESHIFNTLPGQYDVIATTEYNGCYSHDTLSNKIIVKGAKADIDYSLLCHKPHEVNFKSGSTDADKLIWKIDTLEVKNEAEFSFYFDKAGQYKILLEAMDSVSGCPSAFDSTIIHITDLKADFEMPEKVCDNISYVLDAGKSTGVDNRCNKGFLWHIPSYKRPVETGLDTILAGFPSGENIVSLVVEDINGCRDTITKKTQSYGIDLDFSFEKEIFCIPYTLNVVNNTKSDTTVSWKWHNGSTEREPSFVYEESFLFNPYIPYTYIKVHVKDALGCVDSFFNKFQIYRPETKIYLLPGNNLCAGDKILFGAKDYTSQGSHLNFEWSLEGIDTFYQQVNSVILDQKGTFNLKLHFEEESSGCSGDSLVEINVYDRPVANFISDVDSLKVICSPRIITFMDKSIFDSGGNVFWKFDNVTLGNANKDVQSIGFSKGKHEVTLIAQSLFGCLDTLSRSFELVGPEGTVITDKSAICIGEEIEFKLINAVDVNRFEWDFGDGRTIADKNPVKYKFERKIDTTNAKIILYTVEGCNAFIEIPLVVNQVVADFEKYDTSAICEGQLYLNNLSKYADKYIWKTPEGEINNNENPILVLYPGAGNYEIVLIALNTKNGCLDSISRSFELEYINEAYVIPTIFTPNNDGENDFFRPVILGQNAQSKIKFNVFKVYNRWGNLIYDNENPTDGWDGKIKGQLAPSDVYGYYLEANILGCQSFVKKGNITLIR